MLLKVIRHVAAWPWSPRRKRGRSGQAMIEYLIVAASLLAVVAVMALFLYALRLQADRTLTLVSSDYP
ncbi:MAG: hypothetical protein ACOX5G_01335 [Kiritimatiellia bacterium]|jgi:hypothetical protein